jgi:hypothetical protein
MFWQQNLVHRMLLPGSHWLRFGLESLVSQQVQVVYVFKLQNGNWQALAFHRPHLSTRLGLRLNGRLGIYDKQGNSLRRLLTLIQNVLQHGCSWEFWKLTQETGTRRKLASQQSSNLTNVIHEFYKHML